MHTRVLVKFSGEQLSGRHEFGIDTDIARYLANEAKKIVNTGCQLIMVVGGGNVVRGATLAGNGIKRVTADQMGMLSGLLNAMAMTDVFENEGVQTRCMSMIFAEQVAESYSYRRAEQHLEQHRVVIVAGGIARPYFTHDTAAVSIALELTCDVVIKTTKVDGVYTKDPHKYPSAKLLTKLEYQKAVEDQSIRVMDKAALGLAMEQAMPIVVLDAMKEGNILRAVEGKSVGTRIG